MPMQDALSAFYDSITDDQIKEMMNEVDVDNSGSIDYGEFLMLSVPGFCKSNKKKRPLQLPEGLSRPSAASAGRPLPSKQMP